MVCWCEVFIAWIEPGDLLWLRPPADRLLIPLGVGLRCVVWVATGDPLWLRAFCCPVGEVVSPTGAMPMPLGVGPSSGLLDPLVGKVSGGVVSSPAEADISTSGPYTESSSCEISMVLRQSVSI